MPLSRRIGGAVAAVLCSATVLGSLLALFQMAGSRSSPSVRPVIAERARCDAHTGGGQFLVCQESAAASAVANYIAVR
jgi:hypothetical protein